MVPAEEPEIIPVELDPDNAGEGIQAFFSHFLPPLESAPSSIGEIWMKAYPFLECVRATNPLVHLITNWVTIYDCAQVVKSLGASPVMAHAPE